MDWIAQNAAPLYTVPLTAVAMYVVLLFATRLAGLRSFAKLSSFDFAMTVAVGSLMASVIVSPDTSLLQGLLAIASVFVLQTLVGTLRVHERGMRSAVDNEPMLLMDHERVYEQHLREARVTKGDLLAQMRKANVHQRNEVRAIVMETTGDISVIHADPDDPVDLELLLEDVRGAAAVSRPPGNAGG